MLRQMWARLVLGRRTVQEVAADFSRQLPVVKLVLFRWFSAELAKAGVRGSLPGTSDVEISRVYAGQVVNHLAGDLFDPFDDQVPEPVREFALHINEEIPDIADNLMKQDRNLRELVVHTLRMRLILGSAKSPEFPNGPQGRNIGLLLQLYGPEFPEEPNDHRYASLVNTLVAWSKSEQCPGKDVLG